MFADYKIKAVILEPIFNLVKDYTAAAYLTQIFYWSCKMEEKRGREYFWKTDTDFSEELSIPLRTLQRIRTELINAGYIRTKSKCVSGKKALCYHLTDFFRKYMAEATRQNGEIPKEATRQNGEMYNDQLAKMATSYTEITDYRDFREDIIKKEEPVFYLEKPFKDFKSEAPSGGDSATPEEQVNRRTSSASQGNREGDINIDNHGLNDNNTFSGIKSEAVAVSGGGAAAVAWIAALNHRTGSNYPPAASFINQYNKVKKSNNLTDDQLLAVIDNAIASGLAGTWLSPTHLLKNALNFAFAAKAKPKSGAGKITDTDYSRLKCMQGHVYLENPADNPHAVKISIADGYASGTIVDGQTVWHLNGTETQIYREYLIWKELNPDVKKIPDRWLSCNQPWRWLDNPEDNPYARQMDTDAGFESGAIVDGQYVWSPSGGRTSIYS